MKRNSFLIWIPSIQQFVRFKELSWNQQRLLLKTIDDDNVEFLYQMNSIIEENIISKIDYSSFTTLDRFSIFLFLKIRGCGPFINLSKKCHKCDTMTGIQMDLNQFADNIAPQIDKSFKTSIYDPNTGIEVICDLPSIKTEYQMVEFYKQHDISTNLLEEGINNYTVSHIRELSISNKHINIDSLHLSEKQQILNNLPASLIKEIQHSFIKEIHEIVDNVDFLEIECSNSNCKDGLKINFDVNNINDIIKIIYKDNSLDSMLMDIYNLSLTSHINSSFLSELSPLEITTLVEFSKNQQESKEQTDPSNETGDMFAQYREQTSHMRETHSEFS